MKTAMQQHIEWLKATLDICKENAPTLVNCINLCLSDAESRLEMEKQQIENAYLQGFAECDTHGIMSLDKYFNETFKQ
jgi:hypothetical protein